MGGLDPRPPDIRRAAGRLGTEPAAGPSSTSYLLCESPLCLDLATCEWKVTVLPSCGAVRIDFTHKHLPRRGRQKGTAWRARLVIGSASSGHCSSAAQNERGEWTRPQGAEPPGSVRAALAMSWALRMRCQACRSHRASPGRSPEDMSLSEPLGFCHGPQPSPVGQYTATSSWLSSQSKACCISQPLAWAS